MSRGTSRRERGAIAVHLTKSDVLGPGLLFLVLLLFIVLIVAAGAAGWA
jgi:hypothetical protein